MKTGRNAPCGCGSGSKFKKCCGGLDTGPVPLTSADQIRHFLDRTKAEQQIQQEQQGKGRPIVSAQMNGHQIVAVKNRLYWSKNWKTFPDFLGHYIKDVLGGDWGNQEIAKPVADRHPIMQWYDAYCRYQREYIKTPGEVHSGEVNGIVACYLGLAYNLYLIEHNVELQQRLVKRLKDPGNFQGAYYELIVAGVLIRAGFELVLEDESDHSIKHCEFAARSKDTGKRYWVEAKMKSLRGVLGKTAADGSKNPDPTSEVVRHLNAALAKPAADERLIFVDLNVEVPPETTQANPPAYLPRAVDKLERYEKRWLKPGVEAYVFVTSFPFHLALTEPPRIAGVPFGLGMPDFNRPVAARLSEHYRRRRKHRDAYAIADAVMRYPSFPTTFDGSLPSEIFGDGTRRIVIGEKYQFEGAGPDGADLFGEVTSATVNVAEKMAYYAVHDTARNQSSLICQKLNDAELADYRRHPDAFFGVIHPVGKQCSTPFELFEFFFDSCRGVGRDELLKRMGRPPNSDCDASWTDEDLLAEYCEGMVIASGMFGADGKARSPSAAQSGQGGAA